MNQCPKSSNSVYLSLDISRHANKFPGTPTEKLELKDNTQFFVTGERRAVKELETVSRTELDGMH